MDTLRVFKDKDELAAVVAEQSIALLEHAIKQYGGATWVLAGGTTPMKAYEIIDREYKNEIDWSKVTIIIGDERIGPLDGPDNNWHAIDDTLLHDLPAIKIRPESNLRAIDAARHYEKALGGLPKTDSGLPRLDLVWLGMGPDGHTLSLFPGHDSLRPSRQLVIPVHDSPKPPSDRISLTLRALSGAQTALIIASGSDKRDAIATARSGSHLPITLAANIIATHDGNVRWLVDQSAMPTGKSS